MANTKYTFYGYGIVDRLGSPFWDEACICEDRGPMEDIVAHLNDSAYGWSSPSATVDLRAPYRVVTLQYTEVIPKTKGGRKRGRIKVKTND